MGCGPCGTRVVKLNVSRVQPHAKVGNQLCLSVLQQYDLLGHYCSWLDTGHFCGLQGQHWALSQVPSPMAAVTRSPSLIFLKMRSPFLFTCYLFFTPEKCSLILVNSFFLRDFYKVIKYSSFSPCCFWTLMTARDW